MVNFVKLIDETKIGIKIEGENYDELKQVCWDADFSFSKDHGCWIGSRWKAYGTLHRFQYLERTRILKEIWDYTKPEIDTRFERGVFRPELMKSDPLGDFQVRGIKRGISQNRLYLAWEMRLGKTFVTITILNHLIHEKKIDKIVIITPPESIYNFYEELFRFNSFGLKPDEVAIADVNNRNPFENNPKVILMTYRTLLMISDEFYYKKTKTRSTKYLMESLPFAAWGTSRALVLDEVHLVRNTDSRTFKLLNRYKKNFDYRYFLSGTPSPNRVEQFYPSLKLLDEWIVPESYPLWLQKIAVTGTTYDRLGIRTYRPDAVKEFYASITPLVSREFTAGNLSTPEALVKPVYYELPANQMSLYKEVVNRELIKMKEDDEGNLVPRKVFMKFPYFLSAIEDPTRLKKSVDYQLNPDLGRTVDSWKFDSSEKLKIVNEIVERSVDEEKQKTIIWTGHPITADALVEYYKKYNPLVIHGEIPAPSGTTVAKHRADILKTFKTDPKHNLLIVSYLTTGAAVNISEASTMIYFDRSFDLVYWLQSKKRADSHAKTEPVKIYVPIARGTLEAYLHYILDLRSDLNSHMFDLDSLKPETWKALFNGDILSFEDMEEIV
jgi:SNF2 family DNA or RNA helicase